MISSLNCNLIWLGIAKRTEFAFGFDPVNCACANAGELAAKSKLTDIASANSLRNS